MPDGWGGSSTARGSRDLRISAMSTHSTRRTVVPLATSAKIGTGGPRRRNRKYGLSMSNEYEGVSSGGSVSNVEEPVAEAGLIPAATVIALRQSPAGMEVLLLQRNSRGQFGNMWVFPGGRVDPEDSGSVVGDDAELEMQAARAAAV